MRLPSIRPKAHHALERSVCRCQPTWRVIQTEEIHVVWRGGELTVSEVKTRIANDGMFEQINCFASSLLDLTVESNGLDECLCANVEAVGGNIFRRALANRGLLFW